MLCFHCPLVEGMMPEEQLSFPCDFHFSKHILKPEIMVRLFFAEKTIQVLNPNYEYSQKKISMSRTPQYFSRFPFLLSFCQTAGSCSLSLPVPVHLSISLKEIAQHKKQRIWSDRKLQSIMQFYSCLWLTAHQRTTQWQPLILVKVKIVLQKQMVEADTSRSEMLSLSIAYFRWVF